jgi:hypothetical protein
MDKAQEWITRYLDDSVKCNKENAFISDGEALQMLLNGPRTATGFYFQRGLDESNVLHWMTWEKVPDGTEVTTVYVLQNSWCACKPCCTTAGGH